MTELEKREPSEGLALSADMDRIARLGIWLAASEGKGDPRGPAGMAAALRIYFAEQMGLDAIAASELSIIGGRLVVSAKMLRGRAQEAGFEVVRVSSEESEVACTAALRYAGGGEEIGRSTFTIEEAQAAGLVKAGSGWEKWPSRMLWARASKRVIDDFAPNVSLGLYDREELAGVEDGSRGPDPSPEAQGAASPPDEAAPAYLEGEAEALEGSGFGSQATGARADSYEGRDRMERARDAVEDAAVEDAQEEAAETPADAGELTAGARQAQAAGRLEEYEEERKRQARRYFAALRNAEANEPPTGFETWDSWASSRFRHLFPRLTSRAELTPAEWQGLLDDLEAELLPF